MKKELFDSFSVYSQISIFNGLAKIDQKKSLYGIDKYSTIYIGSMDRDKVIDTYLSLRKKGFSVEFKIDSTDRYYFINCFHDESYGSYYSIHSRDELFGLQEIATGKYNYKGDLDFIYKNIENLDINDVRDKILRVDLSDAGLIKYTTGEITEKGKANGLK